MSSSGPIPPSEGLDGLEKELTDIRNSAWAPDGSTRLTINRSRAALLTVEQLRERISRIPVPRKGASEVLERRVALLDFANGLVSRFERMNIRPQLSQDDEAPARPRSRSEREEEMMNALDGVDTKRTFWQALDAESERERSVSPNPRIRTQSRTESDIAPAAESEADTGPDLVIEVVLPAVLDLQSAKGDASAAVDSPNVAIPPVLDIQKANCDPSPPIESSKVTVVEPQVAESPSDEPVDLAPINFYEPLQVCAQVAREEHLVASKTFDRFLKVAKSAHNGVATLQLGSNRNPFTGSLAQEAQIVYSKTVEEQVEKERAQLVSRRDALGKFTIALFGRTMAGKSTFLEYVTTGDGMTIGSGAQNMTKDNRDYPWGGLTLVDTPGIGSYEDTSGNEDASEPMAFRQKAIEAVNRCDIVLFMLSAESIQDDLFKGLEHIFLENKPVIFALNVKTSLTKDFDREFFLDDPSFFMEGEQVDGHIGRLRKLTEQTLGMHRVKCFVIHGQAAFFSTRRGKFPAAERRQLLAASNVAQLLTALESEVRTFGAVRRLQTMLDGSVGSADKLASLFLQLGTKFDELEKAFGVRIGDFERKVETFANSERQRLKAAATKEFARLRAKVDSFVYDHVEDKSIGDKWRQLATNEGIDAALKLQEEVTTDRAKEILSELERDLKFDLQAASEASLSIGGHGLEGVTATDHSRDMNIAGAVFNGVGSAIFLGLALFGGANAWNPIGWAAMGLGLVLGLGSMLWSLLTGGKEKKLRDARQKTAKQIYDQLDQAEKQSADKMVKWVDESLTPMLRNFSRQMREGQKIIGKLAAINKNGHANLEKEVEKLNVRLLERTWILLTTYDTDHLFVDSVVRSRGRSCRATLSNRSVWKAGGKEIPEQRLTDALREKIELV